MTRAKLPKLGSVFLVPLRDRGYGVGVLARANGKGSAFGYFFGPRISDESGVDFCGLAPSNALLVGMFGDLELLRKKWPVIGVVQDWDSARWPMTPMSRIDEAAGRAWVSIYDERTFACMKEIEVDVAEASRYPYDRMMGAGAVEIRLTKLINDECA